MRKIKDYAQLREGDPTKVQKEKGHADIRDHTLKHHVQMFWDLNKDAIQDRMFMLKIDDLEVVLDAEDVLRYLRWV